MTKLKCKKDLYKSTYKGKAFTKGTSYSIARKDEFIWIIDNEGNEFNFSMEKIDPYYYIMDYFEYSIIIIKSH